MTRGDCHYCDGTGEVTVEGTYDEKTGDEVVQRCWYCEGTGWP